MIKLEGLSKSYGPVEAVRDLNLEIREGEILGFIGKNGAGKTTTIKMIMGLVRPTKGDVRFLGMGEGDIRQHIGYLPEELFLYDKLTGREFLKFVGRMYEMEDKKIDERIEELTDLFEISNRKDMFIEGYSQGMRAGSSSSPPIYWRWRKAYATGLPSFMRGDWSLMELWSN